MKFSSLIAAVTVLLCAVCGNPFFTSAQSLQTADKILAIVGKNKIILKSEFEQQAQQTANQQNSGQPLSDSMRCMLLQEMITAKMLVEQADRDSMFVSDEEVEGTLDNRIRYFIAQYGSKEKLETLSGKTVYQMKEENRDVIKEQMLSDKVRNKIKSSIRVTPADVKAFFDRQPKDSLPFYPATIEAGEIVIAAPTNPELDKYAREKIEDIRKQIVVDGKSFETMAGLYTMDPGSRDNGGLYKDVTRNGGFDQTFVTAAFRLQNGEVSPVVKTRFGYHIIQMVERKGEQVDIRHILISPEHTDADYKLALHKLDSIRTQIVAGKMTFQEAVGKFSTDDASKMTGGMISDRRTGSTQMEVDQLDPQLALMLDSLKPGSISEPQQFRTERGELSTRIVFLKSRTEPHRANLQDDYSKIQAVAQAQKEYEKMEKWVEDRLPNYYLKVDPDYSACHSISMWLARTARK
jgi:peptidyl-prolyl cis-trans isomerase SurA